MKSTHEAGSGGLGTQTRKVSTPTKSRLSDIQEARRKVYALQDKAQQYTPADFVRLRNCGKVMISGGKDITVVQGSDRAFFRGLQMCGNVWACPVCARKIQYTRRGEIRQAVNKARSTGYKVTMLTFTHPHYVGQPLAKLIDMHNRAVKRFRQGRWFQGFKSHTGYIGSISSAEVTFGKNGWHWHTHVLYITKHDCEDCDFFDAYILRKRWLGCLKAVGFECNDEYVLGHGLDVMFDCHASDYLTKMGLGSWGAENELSASHAKEAGEGGKTPFGLLSADDVSHWQEYVLATKGRKQIIWSRGLKHWVGLDDISDEELAADDDAVAVSVAVIPQWTWWQILRRKLRLVLLETLETKGVAGLREWAIEQQLTLYFKDWQDAGPPVAA